MIEFTRGNLLEANADALVTTVNTVGVMGKGIALIFKAAFPENFKAYEVACKKKEVRVGRMFVTECRGLIGPKWIINFPTKEHWRGKSKMEWIETGLEDLKRVAVERKIRSIALPPLGCGNGGLNWTEVLPKIEAALGTLNSVNVIIYEPTDQFQNVSKRPDKPRGS
jgi:O-acetyl-ADP-ribose deacetylase (regulator of RNase III)